nr:hypothetical protein [uncultured Flavobacterium sp.]
MSNLMLFHKVGDLVINGLEQRKAAGGIPSSLRKRQNPNYSSS